MNSNFTLNASIKYWAEDDKPREKLVLKGKNALSDAELLAILIGNGYRNKSALDLARELLQDSRQDLNEFSRKNVHELKKVKGIGVAKAVTIVAALELGRRRNRLEKERKVKITSSEQAFDLLRPYLQHLRHEEFYVLHLNRANEVNHIQQLSVGGMTGTIADGKLIFRSALEQHAAALIFAHNHPSGSDQPSQEDVKLTKKMTEFGKYIDLPVIDHLILTDYGYFSFADSGML